MYSYFLHLKCFYDHLQGCKRLSRAIYLWNSCTLCVFLLPNRSTHTNANAYIHKHKTHTHSQTYTHRHTHQLPQPQRQIIGKVCLFVHICTTETNIFMCGICRAEFLWICITNRLDKTDKKKHQHLLCNCRFPLDMQSQQIAERKHWIKRQTSTEYAIAEFLWICIANRLEREGNE